ncbi:hypothetical protein C2845_PM15G26700 [Panicum miliaceum]|uniref:Uncharacterized protein n=1 Tax=Panicum miliaceum TaxID=4540 RepID=A0A3L6Q7R2_PANMI|nr:hypothetical protein C2845_PM15G26700 [Panicum miliaceum]
MEGRRTRRAVAACCLLLIVLLSSGQQQQVAAMTKFCRCYNKCYADCRTTRGPYPCNFESGRLQRRLPHTRLRRPMADDEACVADCTKKLGGDFAPSAANTN